MLAFPTKIHINEEGPREGFQIEKAAIPTARKVEFIDALAKTGLDHIQIVSFVNPKLVPGMADAEEVVRRVAPAPGVALTGLWLNRQGFERAFATERLHMTGSLALSASVAFLKRNQNRTPQEHADATHEMIGVYKERNLPIERAGVIAAFGCNFEGDVPVGRVVDLIGQMQDIVAQHDTKFSSLALYDTMGLATPLSVKRVVGSIQDHYPDLEIVLHLHDTRGLGLANAYAGLEMGVSRFDACVAGLGGCPFAGNAAAAGNVCTEDLIFMCHEMGVETGLDLEALIECARLAEDIVGHPLPGSVMKGGSLARLREKMRAR